VRSSYFSSGKATGFNFHIWKLEDENFSPNPFEVLSEIAGTDPLSRHPEIFWCNSESIGAEEREKDLDCFLQRTVHFTDVCMARVKGGTSKEDETR
jgi:hypothetical protein